MSDCQHREFICTECGERIVLENPPPLLTIGEVARRWAVSEKTIRRLFTTGQVPVVRIGGQLRFDPYTIAALSREALVHETLIQRDEP